MAREDAREIGFETDICRALAERGWIYEDDARDAGWDPALALHVQDVLHWIRTRYPEEHAKLTRGSQTPEDVAADEQHLLRHLASTLSGRVTLDRRTGAPRGGLLGTLHTGFTYAQVARPAAQIGGMVAFPPENPNLKRAQEASEANRLRVVRQVHFDTTSNETIDLVLTVNGVPVVTIELKTDNTQNIDDALKQYRLHRQPGPTRPLLEPGRALVHFAVSNREVQMTTALEGKKTVFLPFNQGTVDGHAGNSPSETGSETDYLWRQVLERDTFLRILKDFAFWQPGDGKGKTASKTAKGKRGKLIFPRYHQLRAVQRVSADVARRSAGGKYLIWHSAGSGKTKTIAWLAHRLIRQCDERGQKVFDSVIVVSDRTVLDRNLREGVQLLRASEGLVVAVGESGGSKSPRLKKALAEGGHIVTCTLQTFPEVLKLMDADDRLADRKWCVIADEAHSSQTGTSSAALRRLLGTELSTSENDEPLTNDDLLTIQDSAVAKAENLTFIALTATPKGKTLRLFGSRVLGQDRWEAFDTYTMAQAIEEGFILDVLRNYSTYDMFAQVRDELGRHEVVDTHAAVTEMTRFVRMHPTSIAQKVEVVVEHFRRNVMHHLDGHAKAMVVTDGRKAAYHWAQQMNRYIVDRGYGQEMRALVAFSGNLDIEGDQITEAFVNGRSDTEGAFRTEEVYRVLIVADKFQTGFDEPRLCAMYVDKELHGIAAVQTLSRLNRIAPGKPDPMVVDFVNDPEQIQKAFAEYYSDAYIDTDVDAQAIYTLGTSLDTAGYYDSDRLEQVSDAFLDNASHEVLRRKVAPIVDAWFGALKQARATKNSEAYEEVKAFRSNLVKYRHAWEFLSQIVDYQDPMLSRRAMLASLLINNLRLDRSGPQEDYLGGVTLAGVDVSPRTITEDKGLAGAAHKVSALPVPTFGEPSEGGGASDPIRDAFEKVIEKVNELFARSGAEAGKAVQNGFVSATWGTLAADPAVAAMTNENSVDQIAESAAFRSSVENATWQAAQGNQELLGKLIGDPDAMRAFARFMAELAVAAHETDRLHADVHEEQEGEHDEQDRTDPTMGT